VNIFPSLFLPYKDLFIFFSSLGHTLIHKFPWKMVLNLIKFFQFTHFHLFLLFHQNHPASALNYTLWVMYVPTAFSSPSFFILCIFMYTGFIFRIFKKKNNKSLWVANRCFSFKLRDLMLWKNRQKLKKSSKIEKIEKASQIEKSVKNWKNRLKLYLLSNVYAHGFYFSIIFYPFHIHVQVYF
jgi:hypothetical protein